MKKLLFLLLPFLAFAIVNGKIADVYPKGYAQVISKERKQCGGFFYGNKYVITAAHCVTYVWSYKKLPVDKIVVYQGSFKRKSGEANRVEKVYLHPDFNAWSRLNDIAIVVLKHPSNVLYIPFISKRQAKNVLLFGFGYKDDSNFSKVMRWGVGEITNKYDDYYNKEFLKKYFIIKSDTPAYYGDSGSPVYNLRGEVVAIVNKGKIIDGNIINGCLKIGQYVSWIDKVITEEERENFSDNILSDLHYYRYGYSAFDWYLYGLGSWYKFLYGQIKWIKVQ